MSCSKKEIPVTTERGEDYFPVATSRFIIYNVDSIVFTEIPKDTQVYSYQLKERISEPFIDAEGKEARKLERFVKMFDHKIPYGQQEWKLKEVWMLNAGQQSVQLVENNVRYVKLIFPVKEDALWHGNPYNDQPRLDFNYYYVHRPENIGGKDFAEVLMVQQLEDVNLIAHQRYYEKYARGTGLVLKQKEDIYSNTIVPGVPVHERIEKGSIYIQTYISHGFE